MSNIARFVVIVVLAAAVAVAVVMRNRSAPAARSSGGAGATTRPAGGLPRLVDLGAGKCIPCKMMAPILEELKKEFAGKLQVEFVDVGEKPDVGQAYGIQLIPTQIFYDAAGRELFRHEGFYSKADILAKWKELGVNLGAAGPTIGRWVPAAPDQRTADQACYMCDGDVNAKTRTVYKVPKGDVVLCSPHCFFIVYTSLLDAAGVDERVAVTDWRSGRPVAAMQAAYLYGTDDRGRPTIKAFASKEDALKERQSSGGNVLEWGMLRDKELACRCGFCDRAVYPEDACKVKARDASLYGCCPACAMGVAARRHEDIQVEVKDALTGELIRIQTIDFSISSLEPKTAVAWAGSKKNADGQIVSTGCFKQAFFTSEDHLKQWLEKNPTATGQMVTIDTVLAAKMKLTPAQIKGACKIGQCVPR
jgi:thioredoxin 1